MQKASHANKLSINKIHFTVIKKFLITTTIRVYCYITQYIQYIYMYV